MKYTLIKGSYHVVSQSPDADSVKFKAYDPALWQQIDTENRAAFERNFAEGEGVIMLRFEGVDALETHYTPPNITAPDDVKNLSNPALTPPKPKGYKQLPAIGGQATDLMLDMLGVTKVKWRTSGVSRYITEATVGGTVMKEKLKDVIPGYIITGDIELNGRPLAWLYTGNTSAPDGFTLSSDQLTNGVEASINYQLLRRGLVYPYYFMSLTGKLRSKLSQAVTEGQAAARQGGEAAKTNVWHIDTTMQGLELSDLKVITEQKAIYPYLFRRILKHQFRRQMEAYWNALRTNAMSMPSTEAVNLDGFFNDANPYLFVASDQDFVRLGDILEANGSRLWLKKSPHDLVFLS